MYYQSTLHAVEDSVLHAVAFAPYKVGDEVTRESGQAMFRVWRLEPWGFVRDLTDRCTRARPPSTEEARQWQVMAEGQEALAARARGVERERFQHNAQAFRYEAALAEEPALHVPRRVLVAPAGIAVLAFDLHAGVEVSSAKASLQVVDVVGAAVGATLERSLPEGAGMLQPLAIAPAGDRVVTPRIQLGHPVGLVERSTADLSEQAEWGEGLMLGPSTTLHPGVDHWLVCSEQGISLHERGSGTPLANSACPAGVIPWEASYGSSGKRLALGGERGRVVVLELETRAVRRFWPHPRARRGDSAAVALSSDGHWLASRLHGTESVVVTRLADGVSWTAAPLVDREVPEPPGQACSGNPRSRGPLRGFTRTTWCWPMAPSRVSSPLTNPSPTVLPMSLKRGGRVCAAPFDSHASAASRN